MSIIILYPIILVSVSFAAPPILNNPLASQLLPDNPAISSVFLIPPSSALVSNTSFSRPALRIPPSWSFSIGFSGATFLPAQDSSQLLSFDAELENGDPIPDWLQFDSDTITFGGVAPKQNNVQVCNVVVSATDSSLLSTSDKFTLIVAPHDLSLSGPLLTRNVTAGTKFSFIIDDWTGVLVDGLPVNSRSSYNAIAPILATPENMTLPLLLDLNTAAFNWLSYDPTSRSLTGTPPLSYIAALGPTIPAAVTLAFPPQSLTVSTNLTLDVFSSAFTTTTFPPILAQPGTQLAFLLSPFLASNATPNFNITVQTDPSNATWVIFDKGANELQGTVPLDSPPNVRVLFTARDAVRDIVSRAEMVVNIYPDSGNGSMSTPTDRAFRKTGKKFGLAVGLVCGILAAIILLAGILAICRRYCSVRERVDDAYVIGHSAFHERLKDDGAYEKESGVNSIRNATPSRVPSSPATAGGRMITKAAFFSAVHERFGSDGSWRSRRAPKSSPGVGGSGKRTRKSKISKPMAVLSSSTSVRDGFADKARGGLNRSKVGHEFSGANFTIFGDRNNGHGSTRSASPNTNSPGGSIAALRPPSSDRSFSPGRILVSPVKTSDLPYDRSRSNSDISHNRASTGGMNSADASRSGSPSMEADSRSLGARTGTQSTFATGGSTRLANAAGDVPYGRPGFDGRRETHEERSLRKTGKPSTDRSPAPIFPPRVHLKVGDGSSTPKAPSNGTIIPVASSLSKVTPKIMAKNDRSATSSPPMYSTPSKASQSSPTSNSTSNDKEGILNPGTSTSSKSNAALQSSFAATSSTSNSTPSSLTRSQAGSDRGLPVLSSYRNVFSNKDNGSDGVDSVIEDVEHAVIRRAISNETMAKQGTMGKPRLVAFTHVRTPATSGQVLRRDVSQRVVPQESEEGDPEAEMRIGLEYVRQLGHPETTEDASRPNVVAKKSTPRISFGSEPTQTPSAEFYASNDSNGSIAGRTRVVSYLKINSHRHRHQTAYSTESAHDSFISSAERDDISTGIKWMVEAELPRIVVGAGEWFEFAAPLDRTHKHTSAPAGSALEAKQADGRPLPEWLRFKKGERQFWGVAPEAIKGELCAALVTRVVVNIWDSEKSEVVGGCLVDVMPSE